MVLLNLFETLKMLFKMAQKSQDSSKTYPHFFIFLLFLTFTQCEHE